jgi:hypothetical protein
MEFDFGEDEQTVIAKSKIYNARTTASVRINKDTGKIGGWESLFELLEMDNDFLAINMEDADEQAENLLKRIRPGDYILSQINDQKFLLEHRDGTKYPISMVVSETGKVTFEGLPEDLEPSMSQFTDVEKRTNPLLTIQAVIREREKAGLQVPRA